MSLETIFLQSAIKRVLTYKELGDKTLMLLSDGELHFSPNEESNNIAVLVQHMAGNMLSRWTDFLTTDGEKSSRERDMEFIDQHLNKQALLDLWNSGWNCFLQALHQLNGDDLLRSITIRGESLLVVDAINRQLTHYPHHVGQIIYIAKIIKNTSWKSLSIPKKKV